MTKKIEFTNEALKQIEKIVLANGSDKYFRISVQGGDTTVSVPNPTPVLCFLRSEISQ